jgi:hypothetical protein
MEADQTHLPHRERRLPVWSASVWVRKIHRRSSRAISRERSSRNASRAPGCPVSRRAGSVPRMRNALTGSTPNPGIGWCDVRILMSAFRLRALIGIGVGVGMVPILLQDLIDH